MGSIVPEVRAAVIGAAVGLLLYLDPSFAGDGHPLVQRLLGGGVALTSVIGFLCIRFLVGPISYAAGTPGGLFAPLLVVGALAGVLFHGVVEGLPAASDPAVAFIIVGMAAFFAAVVRAPSTGIVLVLEMTANTTLVTAMFAACFAAVLSSTLVGSVPIYDILWERMLQRSGTLRSGPRTEPSEPPD